MAMISIEPIESGDDHASLCPCLANFSLAFLLLTDLAWSNFDNHKTQTLEASRPAVASLKKSCKKDVEVKIDWDSFQSQTTELEMIPQALKQVALLLNEKRPPDAQALHCAEINQIRLSYSKKTSKGLNFGLLSLQGNSGSQTFTQEDFEPLWSQAIAYSVDKKRFETELATQDSVQIKKICEKRINFSVDWSSVTLQNPEIIKQMSLAVNSLRNSFHELKQKGSHEKVCSQVQTIQVGRADQAFIEFQSGVLKSYAHENYDEINSTSALTSRLEKGTFTRVTQKSLTSYSRKTASPSQDTSPREKSKLEQEIEEDASEVKNDIQNEARRKGKNKVKDALREKLFKGF